MPRLAALVCLEHARNKVLQAVYNSHQIHAHHPLPVARSVFPYVTAASHPRVIDQQVDIAECAKSVFGKALNLCGLCNVDDIRNDHRAGSLELVDNDVERITLNVS